MPSNRVVSVKLRAEMDQYKREMAQAAAATERLGGSGHKAGMRMSSAFKAVATSAAALGVAKLVKDSIDLEAAYSKTMRQVAVQTKAPKSELAELDKLALKLGADTVFSAQDAADAMLELAKGGLSTAQIEAGALKNSLTLAAAGGLELGDAANSVVNTMGAFQLGAKDTGVAVAALAGAANASSADVSDITQALQQAGTSAHSAGLSVQETTAMLAAFSNAGIRGSDAGTSLRTMLTRLVPQTKQQATEMERLHLSFTKSNGEFVSGAEIAGRLQKAYKGMSAEERTASLQKVFGQDAQRAANVLINQGAKGISDLTKETSDLTAAQKLADAGMSGTSGAMEQLSGAIETAKIEIGKGLAPVVQDIASDMSDWLENADIQGWANDAGRGVEDFVNEMKPLVSSLYDLGRSALPAVGEAGGAVVSTLKVAADVVKPFVDAFNALPDSAQKALVLAAGAQALNKRFSLTERLASSASSQLVTFGTSAATAGSQSQKGAAGVNSLSSNLKSFGVTAAAAFAFDQVGDTISGFQKSVQATGEAATSVAKIRQQLASSNIGKAAGSLGIDLDRLATDIGKYGKNGEYVAEVTALLGKNAHGAAGDIAELGAFINPAFGKLTSGARDASRASDDLSKILSTMPGTLDQQAQAAQRANNEFLISAYGMEQYKDQLVGIPTEVLTKILTPGAIKSADDIRGLVEQYELTPDLVRTLVKTSGVDVSAGELRSIIALAERIDRKKAKAAVKAVTTQAESALRNVLGLLGAVRSKSVQVKITRTFQDQGKSSKNLADMLSDPAGRATGGTVPSGYAGGGKIPGNPPSNPLVDNMLAVGATSGKVLKVRSGEWIVNEKQSKANDKWLAAINGGLNLDDFLGAAPGYASGGQYDPATALELTQMRVRVRDLRRSLREREKYGKKDKHGHQKTRLALRGLDRLEAKQELSEALAELRGSLRVTRAGRRKGMGPVKYAAYLEQQAELKEAKADAKSSFMENASIGEFRSPASVERALQKALVDMATFTSLLISLKKKGASPWLLEQLQKAGPSSASIALARKYASDTAALKRVNALASQASSVSGIYGNLADPKWSGTLTSAQSKTLTSSASITVNAVDPSQVAREVARLTKHYTDSAALGAGI